MRLRSVFVSLPLLLAFVGCNKPSNRAIGSLPDLRPAASNTVIRIHWVGKRQLAWDGTAYYFNRLWDLQESKALEVRTLNNLAVAPWRFLHGDAAVPELPALSCRELLESLKYEESYLEIRSTSNASPDFALAVRLSNSRAAAWQSNLAMVVDSLTGLSPEAKHATSSQWSVILVGSQTTLSFARYGDWSLFGIAGPQSTLLRDLRNQIHSRSYPFSAPGRSHWLEADVDLSWVVRTIGVATNLASALPKISLSTTGDGGNVLTHVLITFQKPLATKIDPWSIPTELIHEPLTSFSMARSVREILLKDQQWNSSVGNSVSDQFFSWSRAENPFEIYAAAVVRDAGTQMNALTTYLLNHVNPWLTNNGPRVNNAGIPIFEELPDRHGVRWTLQDIWPFIRAVDTAKASFLLAGLTPERGQASPFRSDRLKDTVSQTNIVYWSWESTGSRLHDWMPVLQTTRLLAHHSPLPEKSLSAAWLAALELRLRETETRIARTGPGQLTLDRKSTSGLTALELHLLADWLESPEFPRNLHTLSVPPSGPTP